MKTLLTISEEILELERKLEEAGGDLENEEIEQAYNAWLEANASAKEKLDNYAAIIRELTRVSKAAKEEAELLRTRSRAEERKARFLKDRLMYYFMVHGLKTEQTDRFRITLANNGGVLPLDLQTPAELLPERFQKVTIDYDTEAIRAALDNGEYVPGAQYLDRGQHMRIS